MNIEHPLKGKISFDELDEIEALLILCSMHSLGSVKIRLLLQHFDSARQALQADPKELIQFPGFSPKIVAQWLSWKTDHSWRRNLELIDKENVQVFSFTSREYPKQLLALQDPPLVLYVKGNIAKVCQRCIAIVGTRQASIYGNEMALEFSRELAAMGYIIVSGLARGIDTSAHLGAIETGITAAVIGSGLADIYPVENRKLAEKISQEGCLISEFPMATPPDRQNFPQRNRIVAALSQGILLIEAPLKSGAMLTMHNGWGLGKKLFAIPGRVDNKNFCGNHALIKERRAQLVEAPGEIAGCFEDLFMVQQAAPKVANQRIHLDKEEMELLQLFPKEEIAIEEIVQRSQLPMTSLNVLLMSLVLKRAVKEFPGKVYKKTGV